MQLRSLVPSEATRDSVNHFLKVTYLTANSQALIRRWKMVNTPVVHSLDENTQQSKAGGEGVVRVCKAVAGIDKQHKYTVLVFFWSEGRESDGLFVGCLLAKRPSNMPVYLKDGSPQTILRAATLR